MNKKVVIFSQWKKMVDIIVRELKNELKETEIIQVDGSINSIEKNKRLNFFRNCNNNAILCTSDALNYGINLAEADTLIHFDLPFVPSKIEQREGRIDRLTQKNKMLIIKLVMRDSIEHKVLAILKDKMQSFNTVVEGKEKFNQFNIFKEIYK